MTGGMLMALIIVLTGMSIPLSAIVLNSALGKAMGRYLDRKSQGDPNQGLALEEINKLRIELDEQRKMFYELQEDNQKLEDKYSFLERLLEAPKKD